MANVAITNTFVAATTIVASQVNQNFTDLVNYINARNGGSTAWDNLLVGTATFNNTTNQLVLGATRTVTLTAPTPASSSRTWTIPDITGNGTFAALEGTQTFSGAKTFSSALTVSAITNQVVLGTTNTTTITSSAPASSRVYTIPDAGGDTTFIMSASNQTLTGDKTFSGNLSAANTKFQIGGNQAYPIVQIVMATTTTSSSKTSSTFADTNLTASITPKFNTSKILVQVSGCINGGADIAFATIARGGSNLLGSNGGQECSVGSTVPCSLQVYDSPATTSATTYSVQLKNGNNSSSVSFGATNVTQYITLMEIAQ